MKKWVKGNREKGNWYKGKQLTQEQMTPRAEEAVWFVLRFPFFLNTWASEKRGKRSSVALRIS